MIFLMLTPSNHYSGVPNSGRRMGIYFANKFSPVQAYLGLYSYLLFKIFVNQYYSILYCTGGHVGSDLMEKSLEKFVCAHGTKRIDLNYMNMQLN